ncbi:MAG TPA: archaeosortase/exosortase family protein [Candidatus Norongarragalinales archaeon]|nr:archaeosortase/exosortase family protein [Candidatus Norongarragalinales archaeon]
MLKKGEIGFLAKFLALISILFLLLKTVQMGFLLEWIASWEYGALRFLNLPAILDGATIALPSVKIRIVPECSGLFMPILLAALLWSTKIEAGKRIRYMLIFTPLLFLFNLIRLFATIFTLAVAPGLFDLMHITLWFVDSAIVLLIWMDAQGIKITELLPASGKGKRYAK